jgi:hypothetical protein
MTVKLRTENCSLWKTHPQSSIKPAIARDTTCSVSPLTCTTGRSNFAIPSTEISSHGNGVEVRRVKEHRQLSEPEVTRQLQGQIEAQAPGFLIRESGAQTFHIVELQPFGGRRNGGRKPGLRVRWPCPDPPPEHASSTARVATGASPGPRRKRAVPRNYCRWSSPNPGARNGNPYQTSF